MNPGRMRSRVTIQSRTRTDDEGGGHVEAWADDATVWAEVEAMGGTEQLRAMAVGVQQPHRIRMWYRAGLTPAARLIERHPDGDRVHDITSVRDPSGARQTLELLTEVIS